MVQNIIKMKIIVKNFQLKLNNCQSKNNKQNKMIVKMKVHQMNCKNNINSNKQKKNNKRF